jgi:Ca-activated chloride channel family protein
VSCHPSPTDLLAFAGGTRRPAGLLVSCLLVVVSLTRLGAQSPVFRSGAEIVSLTVTVTDAAGRYVTGLTEKDFAVFENGMPQQLSFFASEPVPVDVAFVVDTSGSMTPNLPVVKQAARGLLRELRNIDRAVVVQVQDTVDMPQSLTNDFARAAAAIDALRARGSTAIYDGVYLALREFERTRRHDPRVRRQALILLSDGVDNSSHVTLDVVSDLARQLGVIVYSIGLGSAPLPQASASIPRREVEASYALRALAADAGGRAFFPTVVAGLPAIYETIGRELASQYALGYVPLKPGDGEFRRVAVRVLPPTKATARTRTGYIAVRPSTAISRRPSSDTGN